MILDKLFNLIPAVIMLGIFLIFIKTDKKYKKIKAGPLELEAKDDQDNITVIDPGDACPYDKAYTSTRNEIRNLQQNVHNEIKSIGINVKELNAKLDQIIVEVDEMDTDQLKILFRSTGQPPEDRLLAGLRYVKKGKNGDMRRAVIDMSKKWRDMYSAICVLKPDYRIDEVEDYHSRSEK
jgi:hypothetical protein